MGSIAVEELLKERESSASTSCTPMKAVSNSQDVPPPIAIVGMGMRLPGGITSAEEFWDFLVSKGDARSKIPESRFNIDAFYNSSKPGSVRTEYGYFLNQDLAHIDTSFFSMVKYEAERLDPQQRLLLEVVWECLESAGVTGWRGKDIGCFVGSFGEDWLDMSSKDTQDINRVRAIGAGDFALANRVSYEYDLKGPSITFRTACSAAMVALHNACLSLSSGECSAAIVAGTNLALAPTMATTMSDNLVLSPSGICRSFDADADGYGRGEAINAVYIKRLEDAVRDGDPIRAVIRSTATNCDGRTPNISMPGAETQASLIHQAYSQAKISDLSATAFIECHGTGTVMGDVAELTAVAKAFGEKGIYIGSVKPNVGHSEGASGLTSIIKATLALENKIIPPNINFKTPNPKEPTTWPHDRSERVSINCFGIGGTNVHVIIDSAASFTAMNSEYLERPAPQNKSRLLVLSANSQNSLQRQVENLKAYVESRPEVSNDLCFNLGARREHLKYRAFTILEQEGSIDTAGFETSQYTKSRSMVFVFTGQGAQWVGMGKELLLEFDIFRNDIKAMDTALQKLKNAPCWSIEDELLKSSEDSRVNEPEYAQPLCTAVQIALSNLLELWGLFPTGVIGHSSGEIAAAYSAGAITLESAIIISYYRGQVTKSISENDATPQGGMAAVGLSPEKVKRYLIDGVVIACENSPQSVTISGDSDKLDKVIAKIQSTEDDIFCRRLRVGVAYHSHHMQGLTGLYQDLIGPHISFKDAMIPFYSSVTGNIIIEPIQLDAKYWAEILSFTVLFSTAVGSYLEKNGGNALFLEIGPHSALSGPLRQIFDGHQAKLNVTYIPTLIRGEGQRKSLLTAAGRAYMNGSPISFSEINGPGRVLTDLPKYPWQHDVRYWGENLISQRWRSRQHPHHEILGSRVYETSDIEPTWRNLLYVEHTPWIWEHRLNKEIVFPCAGYIAMIGEAIYQITGSHAYSIRNLFMKRALILEDSSVLELVTSLRPVRLTDSADSKWYEFTISSCNDNTWQKHCTGRVIPGDIEVCRFKEHKGPFIRQVQADQWYSALANRGLHYGPRFRGLENITADPIDYQATASIADDENLHESHYSLHPSTIDQCLQLFSVAFTHGISRQMTKLSIPVSIEKLYISTGALSMAAHAKGTGRSSSTASGRVVMTLDNKTVLWMEGAQFFTVDEEDTSLPRRRLISRCVWKPIVLLCSIAKLSGSASRPSSVHSRRIVGQFTNLLILECFHRIKHLKADSPHLVKYQGWIISQTDRLSKGLDELFPETSSWAAASSEARLTAMESLVRELEVESPRDMPLIDISKTLLDHCPQIIEGKVSPLEVLMEDDRIKNVYNNLCWTSGWSDFFGLFSHWNPNLRVLEIGGGVGSATATMLLHLAPAGRTRMYSKYTFTDISPGVLPLAKERFKDFEEIEYSVLDISKDPTKQGYSPESFDLIIASNSTYACYWFLEVALYWRNFAQGVLPGWWLGGGDGREDTPLVSPERWGRELQKNGFSGAEAVFYDCEQPYHYGAGIWSRRADIVPVKGDIYLLHHPTVHEWAYIAEAQLSQRGYTVHWCTLDQLPAGKIIISLLDLGGPFFDKISEGNFRAFQKAMSTATNCRMIWVTRGSQLECSDPRYGLVLGLARTLRFEMDVDFSTFEVDKFDEKTATSLCDLLKEMQIFREKPWLDQDYEFAVRDGVIHIGRFHWTPLDEEITTTNKPNMSKGLHIGTYGLLDSLSWVEYEEPPVGGNDVMVEIKYTGLNFRDIMVTLGALGDTSEIGLESSGTIFKVGSNVKNLRVGQRILALGIGLLRTRKVIPANHCVPIPDGLSLEDAATMTSVYATVILSLIRLGNLQKNQIYATVGNEQKRKYLVENHQIPEDHIFDSRSASFFDGVMRHTNGRGVDLVLNSLSGELLHASWRCVAEFGRMIELGKRDIMGHAQLSMDGFSGNRAYFGVDLFRLGETDATMFGHAFRYMQTGKHMGKIIIKMPEDPAELPVAKNNLNLSLSPGGSYLLAGGLGGLGRPITTWMIEKGARNFIFLSRSAGESDSDKAFLRELDAQGCTATVVKGNVTELDDVKRAATASPKPVVGVINLAMVLRDEAFEKMTYDDWNAALAPKVQGTWNLHNVFKDVSLDFFILTSSISGMRGNFGQANYNAANTFLDTFVRYRKSMDLPVWAIDVGAMQEIGHFSQDKNLVKKALANSIEMPDNSYLVDALQVAMLKSKESESGQFAIGLGTSKPPPDSGNHPLWPRDARFTINKNLQWKSDKANTTSIVDLRSFVEDIKKDPSILDSPESKKRIAKELRVLIGPRAGLDENADDEEIDNIVIDSLMSIEIRSWFRRNLSLDVPLIEISNAKTVGGLTATTMNALRCKYQSKSTEDDGKDSGISTSETPDEGTLKNDILLGTGLQPTPGPTIDWKCESEGRIFLTGATGFIGAWMLASLLGRPDVKIVACLVRARDENTGLQRIKETFKKYGIEWKCDEKLAVIPGDISKPKLGLEGAKFDELSAWTSAVFHFAALSNFLEPYSAHREANVIGTFNMLQFATNKRRITFHHSSSLSACGLNAYLGKQHISEDQKPEVDLKKAGHHIGYSYSKYTAEMVLWNAISNGVPASIYRFSMVLGHSVTGIGNDDDATSRMMSNCIQIGSYPIAPKQRSQFVPVDFAVSCMLEISTSLENIGHAYNVIQPDQEKLVDLPATFDMLRQCCPSPLRPVPYEDWLQSLAKFRAGRMSVFLPEMEDKEHERRDIWQNIHAGEHRYGTDNLRRALAHRPEMLQLPSMDKLMKVWSAQWIKQATRREQTSLL
ncbi:polyketide synthase, putative [Trichophyton verrucosum HKI 0517]|uniref:Polyketide synthase, putative n=1 Tax=Trichophyton verrucosum (strain HKI 0517) TaxID=663202 RepID=D4D1W9_TRIVH|nr:polyketide synthase, putative [Trichophyton verrucosum HKI 0517]EFE44178.1 polyketide synthase, putative [Trichophyton verrucosum HKI 0517]